MTNDLLLYDGHCRFCSASARSIRKHSRSGLELVSFRDEGVPERFGLSLAMLELAVHLVRRDGRIEAGVLALVGALRHRWFGPLLSLVRLPGLHAVAALVYRQVSRWRFRIAGRDCSDGCAIYQR